MNRPVKSNRATSTPDVERLHASLSTAYSSAAWFVVERHAFESSYAQREGIGAPEIRSRRGVTMFNPAGALSHFKQWAHLPPVEEPPPDHGPTPDPPPLEQPPPVEDQVDASSWCCDLVE